VTAPTTLELVTRYEQLLLDRRWPASQEAARRAVHALLRRLREEKGWKP